MIMMMMMMMMMMKIIITMIIMTMIAMILIMIMIATIITINIIPIPFQNHNSIVSRDSGRGSYASSVRWSQDSSGSANSDIISSCPPSPSFIPNNIVFEMDETEDHGEDDDDDRITSLSSGQNTRQRLPKSVIYSRVEKKGRFYSIKYYM